MSGPQAGEDLCYLCGDWRILQRVRGHRWSLDDLVTAWIATAHMAPPAHIADLGCGIEAYCQAAAALLTPGGSFVACHAARQVARVEAATKAADLVIAQRMEVIPRAGKAPLFTVYRMRRDRVAGAVLPPLVVRDRHGQWTAEFRALRADMGMPA